MGNFIKFLKQSAGLKKFGKAVGYISLSGILTLIVSKLSDSIDANTLVLINGLINSTMVLATKSVAEYKKYTEENNSF